MDFLCYELCSEMESVHYESVFALYETCIIGILADMKWSPRNAVSCNYD